MSRKTLSVLGVLAVAVGLGMAPTARAAAAFTMAINATGDIVADYLTFGMAAGATDVYDSTGTPADEPAPPPAPSGNDIYFLVNGAVTRLATDIRPVVDSKVWELHVVLGPGDSTILTWGAVPAAISGSELWLKNKQTGAVVKNMKIDTSVTVNESTTYLIVLGPPNTAPVAQDDEVFMLLSDAPVTIAVLANDYDADAGQTLLLNDFTQPPAGQGTTTQVGNQISYDPLGYTGITTFTYTIIDNGTPAQTATATVTVHISGNVVGKRTHDVKGKPGKPFPVAYEIRYSGTLATLKLTEILPLNDQQPPGWWDYVDGSFAMTSAGTAPTVTELNGELTFDFGTAVPASPVQFTVTLTVPAADVNPKTFLGRIDYQLSVGGAVLSENMPETTVRIQRANLDIDGSANGVFYNLVDWRLLFNYQYAGGKADNAKLCAGTPHAANAATLGPVLRATIEGMISDLDIDNSNAGAFYNLVDLRILFNYQFAGGKADNTKLCNGTPHAPNAATKGPEFRAKIDGMIGG